MLDYAWMYLSNEKFKYAIIFFFAIFFESPPTRNFRYKMMNDWSINATLGYIFVLLYYYFYKFLYFF